MELLLKFLIYQLKTLDGNKGTAEPVLEVLKQEAMEEANKTSKIQNWHET